MFVIIIGPSSGAGKTTLVNALLKELSDARKLTTYTTRAPRAEEKDGEDFHFVTRGVFEKLRDAGEMLEWSEHLRNYYGAGRKDAEQLLATHRFVIATLDINGARQVKAKMPDALTIFLKPGSVNDLKRRLAERDITDKDRQIRFDRIDLELAAAPEFDHRVVNREDEFDKTLAEVLRIIALQ